MAEDEVEADAWMSVLLNSKEGKLSMVLYLTLIYTYVQYSCVGFCCEIKLIITQ